MKLLIGIAENEDNHIPVSLSIPLDGLETEDVLDQIRDFIGLANDEQDNEEGTNRETDESTIA